MNRPGEAPRKRAASLEGFFHPRSIALIGATDAEHTVGNSLLSNLRAFSAGPVYPVNPRRKTVSNLDCYPSVGAVPGNVDLAVVATPAAAVPGVIGECVEAGVPAAIIVSAGFRETGEAGAALEREILQQTKQSGMRIIGPNCLGVMNPYQGLNATFANSFARQGHLAFISQSGALCTAILDWSHREMVGFSAFVSIGSMLDVGWGDLIQYLGDDPRTRSIILYMESVGDAKSFLSAAREVALSKPIIVIKPGRTEAAAKAAASHTGALAGQDDVLDAAFRRCGVLRVDTIAKLFYLAEALDKQPRPRGPRLTIVTNAGGPAVLATDALLMGGGKLAQLSAGTIGQLNKILPAHWSRQNPIDILGDATPERYAQAVELAAQDPATDGLLVILAPQAVTDPAVVAEQLASRPKSNTKPILASWMGGSDVAGGEAILNGASIPTYAYPDAAARVFESMWRYSANLAALYETPEALPGEIAAESRVKVAELLMAVRRKERTLLTEAESKGVLAAYGIATVPTEIASSPDQAREIARRIGFPVVLKLHSQTITHKTDVGGVRLNLTDESAVRTAFEGIAASVRRAAGEEHFLGVTVQPMVRTTGYELILGSSVDTQFGPVLLFGSGGQLVEVYRDRAIGLPPLNRTLARRLMERTKIFTALQGVRGRKPVDLGALEELVVRFSYLVTDQPWIKEIDINPLLASPDGLLALDARVVLYPPGVNDPPRSAIRPFPNQYVRSWRFTDGSEVLIRPIKPEDEPLIVRFHARLSERSVYLRYFHLMDLEYRTSHQRLIRICFNDYDREIALVAERRDLQGTEREILAVGRLVKTRGGDEADLAILISDEYHGHGLGTELWRRLIEVAKSENVRRATADILAENAAMISICRDFGFRLDHRGGGVVRATLDLMPS